MLATYSREIAGGAQLSLFHVDSAALKGNALGDPHERACPLLVPAGGGSGLPLVAILVGFTGCGHKVLNVNLWSQNIPERIASATAAGKIPPAVYVWPACETKLGGSQYLNSSATGNYEDFVRDELVPQVEAAHGCGGDGRRLVAGKSSGGYGALTLAMRNPGWVAGLACHAGDMGFEFGYWRDFPDGLNVIRRHGGVQGFLEALPGLSINTPEIHALDLIAMSACYSPNPSSALGFDLPVELETCEPIPAVFDRWLANDPLRMVESAEMRASLSGLKAFYFDAGERDEFALQWGLRRMVQRLQKHGVQHRAEFFQGGHFDMDDRYEVSLPYLLAALD